MDLEYSGEIWFWRGPAPFHFVTVPPSAVRRAGVGVRACELRLGHDSGLRADRKNGVDDIAVAQRRALHRAAQSGQAERLEIGDTVTVRLNVDA
jgi:hypothetical protein